MAPEARAAAILALVGVLASPIFAARLMRPVAEQTKIDYLVGEVRSRPRSSSATAGSTPRAAPRRTSRRSSSSRERGCRRRDFVLGIASRSEKTGKPYEIRWPNGKRQPLSEWLFELLEYYEQEYLMKTP